MSGCGEEWQVWLGREVSSRLEAKRLGRQGVTASGVDSQVGNWLRKGWRAWKDRRYHACLGVSRIGKAVTSWRLKLAQGPAWQVRSDGTRHDIERCG